VDVTYVLHEITFTWDEAKARVNLRKHRVAFEVACEVFFDPFIQVVEQYEKDGELRQAAMGMTTALQLVFVAFVLRTQDIRLISARKPTTSERKRYEAGETP